MSAPSASLQCVSSGGSVSQGHLALSTDILGDDNGRVDALSFGVQSGAQGNCTFSVAWVVRPAKGTPKRCFLSVCVSLQHLDNTCFSHMVK